MYTDRPDNAINLHDKVKVNKQVMYDQNDIDKGSKSRLKVSELTEMITGQPKLAGYKTLSLTL